MDDWQYLNYIHIPLILKYTKEAYRRGFLHSDLSYEVFTFGKKRIFKIEEDCLILLRRSVIGRYVLKLTIQPISLNEDIDKEQRLLDKYLNLGFSFFSQKENIPKNLKLEYVGKSESSGSDELIYTQDSLKLDGQKYKNVRAMITKYEKLVNEGKIIKKWLTEVTTDMTPLYKLWTNYKKIDNKKNKNLILDFFKFLPKENIQILAHYTEDNILFHCQFMVSIDDNIWYVAGNIKNHEFFKELSFGWLPDIITLKENPNIKTLLIGATNQTNPELVFSKTRIPHIFSLKETLRYRKTTIEDYTSINNINGYSFLESLNALF